MVTHLNTGDSRSNFNHDSRTFVTSDDGEETFDSHEGPKLFGRHHVSGHQVFIAVAHPSSAPVNNDFAGLGRMDFDLLDLPVLVETPQHCGF